MKFSYRLLLSGTASLAFIGAVLPNVVLAADLKPNDLKPNDLKNQDKPELVYEMKQGDTLLALVAKYFSNPDALNEIVRVNQIKNVYKIPVGQKLVFPRVMLNFYPSQAHVTSIDCHESIYLAGQQKELHLGDALVQGAKDRPFGQSVFEYLVDYIKDNYGPGQGYENAPQGS